MITMAAATDPLLNRLIERHALVAQTLGEIHQQNRVFYFDAYQVVRAPSVVHAAGQNRL
jgi:hypothetical protein